MGADICKCGICALDCEYHRPAPEKKGKYTFQWEEIDQHGNTVVRKVECDDWPLLKSDDYAVRYDTSDAYEVRLHYYGQIQQPPPPCRKNTP